MRKLTGYLLTVYFILLLAVPGYFVYRHYDTLYTGESYKFDVVPYDPYDPFRGRYVSLQTTLSLSSTAGEYAVFLWVCRYYRMAGKQAKNRAIC